ncbi:putative ABC transport system ATP-binding protein/ATP-binding cassette subfamily B protein [Tumebacillus sp. BK434]|uniref:ABC transporter ATP-binding protein n=1 Tax=Tumebacillus sp. BK434 TaxID=2512169 RepID=UPI00104F4B2D|nr:ABC transporter ATP-binding protein [Tumebacillus sp. BK434]TCP57653.1 putative ABC transport system ATP-binding protein/ATP-binding cassette subfamily B protein [Tumebacillus sp. BK434]
MAQRRLLQAFLFVWTQGKWWLFLSVLYGVLQGLSPMAAIWLTKELINTIVMFLNDNEARYGLVLIFLIGQFSLAVFTSMLKYVQEYTDFRMENHMGHYVQLLMTKRAAAVPFHYYDLPAFHHHYERIQGSGSRILSPIKNVMQVLTAVITLVSMMIYMLSIHWLLALSVIVVAVPQLYIQTKLGHQRFWLNRRQTPTAREANYIARLFSDRQSAKEIRLFGLVDHLLRRWSSRYLKNAREQMSLLTKQQKSNLGLDAMSAAFYIISALLIIYLLRLRSLQIGDFIAIGQAVQGAQNAIKQLTHLLAAVYEDRLYLDDFFKFLELEFEERKAGESRAFPQPLNSGITFENVHFRYPDSNSYQLKNVSFQIEPGEKIAIVGENGSGKTTLVKCMLGLYPLEQGSIRYDGIPIEDFEVQELRKHFTVIFQDFVKYSFSVHDNISLGDVERDVDEERVTWASRTSGVHDFVEKFPNGYETPLGRFLAEGEDLSGGQWQKIALARAIYRDAPIIVLDEPTSALDPIAEMDIFGKFREVTESKTAFFISHRMAAAKMADRILVMKSGEVLEMGTHDELMRLQGEYYHMFTLQASWYERQNEIAEVV